MGPETMMDAKTALLLLILRMLGQRAESPRDLQRLNGSRPYVRELVDRAHKAAIEIRAGVAAEHAERLAAWRKGSPRPAAVPADLVAAVGMKENSERLDGKGAEGEVGLLQVKPDGLAQALCPDLLAKLERPSVNVLCGVRLLAYHLRRCGDVEGALSRYNGADSCRPTAYSAKVLAILERARARLVAER